MEDNIGETAITSGDVQYLRDREDNQPNPRLDGLWCRQQQRLREMRERRKERP